jgi:hypothetical protein
MKLAVMQPYFFPYLGYWQLIAAADRFVIFDDVNFIVRGWINRNRILINGEPRYITVPIHHASQNCRICDTELEPASPWRARLVRMVDAAYRSAPHFAEVFPVVQKLLVHDVGGVSEYLQNQLQTLARFMGLRTEFVTSSRHYGNQCLSGQERILDICRREGATTYVNLPGGESLYQSHLFAASGIDLRFIASAGEPYAQRGPSFVPNLSVIDALMEIGPAAASALTMNFSLTASRRQDG